MTTYNYGTILRAAVDDPHPDNDVVEGDIHVKPGKHPNGDQYTTLTEEGPVTVEFETVEVYELPNSGSKRDAVEHARDQFKAQKEEMNDD